MMAGLAQGWIGVTLAIVLAVSGFVIPIAALVYLILERRSPRAKAQPPPKPVRPKPLRRLLAGQLERLGREARRFPFVLVIGDRCAGKTSLVSALLHEHAAVPTGDRRLTLRAGSDVIYIELGSELFEDRLGAGLEIERLFARIAQRTCKVLLVVNAQSAAHDSTRLAQLGRTTREFVEMLTLHRQTPIPLRVCLTHLDHAEPGFTELAHLLGAEDWEGTELRETRQGPVLAGLLHDFFRTAPLLEKALISLAPAEVERLTTFFARGSSSALGRLETLYQELHGLDTGKGVRDEPLALCALRDGEPPLILGDPVRVDTALVVTDLHHYDRYRFNRALAYGALASVFILAAYALRLYRLEHAVKEFDAFLVHASSSDEEFSRSAASTGAALHRALTPLWPPLRYAFPSRRRQLFAISGDAKHESIRGQFLRIVGDRYLRDDRTDLSYKEQLYGAALRCATSDSRLGEYVLADTQRFATVLRIPEAIVSDYVQLNTAGCSAVIHAKRAAPGSWWPLQRVLRRADGVVERTELQEAADNACQLKATRVGSASDPEQVTLESAFRASCRSQAEAIIGNGDGQRLPTGVTDPKAFEELLEAACSDTRPASANAQTLAELVSMLRKLKTKGAEPDAADTGNLDACTLSERGDYTAARWRQVVTRSRAATLVATFSTEVVEKRTDGAPFFTKSDSLVDTGLGTHGLGAALALPGRYRAKVAEARVVEPIRALPGALFEACIDGGHASKLREQISSAFDAYAIAYGEALQAYYRSFRFPYANLSSLRTDLASLVTPGGWFDQFWSTLGDNSQLHLGEDTDFKSLTNAVTPFASLAALQKDGHVDLGKYDDLLRPYLAALEERSPAAPGPPLADRLSPLGKLGLLFLDPNQVPPVQQVQQLLDALGIGQELRTPFMLPAERIQALAIGSLERAVSHLYESELAPTANSLWQKFPFAPLGENEVSPKDVVTQLGEKGMLKAAFATLIAPVVTRAPSGAYAPAKVGTQSLLVPAAALALGRWIDSVTSMLFDDSGKPKELVLSLRSDPLLRVEPGDRVAATNGHVTAGNSTVVAINQAPGWQKLSVPWTSPVSAQVGLSLRGQNPSDTVERTRLATGENWQVLHLLCDADTLRGDGVAWQFGSVQVAFELEANPFEKLVAPGRTPTCTMQITDKKGEDGAPIVISSNGSR